MTTESQFLSTTEIRSAALREAALHLYTALFPAVYDDMGQKAAEGVQRAVSELRRMADETATTQPARDCPPDCPCRAVCIGTRPTPAETATTEGQQDTCRSVDVDGQTISVRGSGDFTDQDRKFFGEVVRAAKRRYAAEHPDEPAAGPRQDGAAS